MSEADAAMAFGLMYLMDSKWGRQEYGAAINLGSDGNIISITFLVHTKKTIHNTRIQ